MAKPSKTAAEKTKSEKPAEKLKAAKPEKSAESKAKATVKADKSRVKFESTLPRLEAVAYFDAIVAGLRKGAVKFKQGDDAISLAPADHVDIEVKAQRKKNKEQVSFEITWRTDDDADLTISAS